MSETNFVKLKEMKRLEAQALTAAALISSLELKMMQNEEDNQRIRANIEVQKKIKEDSENDISKMKENKE